MAPDFAHALHPAAQIEKPKTMKDDQWEAIDRKALLAIQLCSSNVVLREVVKEDTTTGL